MIAMQLRMFKRPDPSRNDFLLWKWIPGVREATEDIPGRRSGKMYLA